MTSRSVVVLLLLIVATALCRPHRETVERHATLRTLNGEIDTEYYNRHPNTVFRACGKPLLQIALGVLESCSRSSDKRASDRGDIIICCRRGCSINDIVELGC
ncbi:hypothetical protein PENTCL1PPCAC_3252 [Pristionchus entomophagus]|uniref:Insulin-like domain-containing protein n=1 Tax=Pristionchus entomophagus TaxID=358040 RepID=A0AAV5SER0_9BILA|nr:hypothetical protein PENTCL1PPCAC_3252 [Pristionchus entomophagus]